MALSVLEFEQQFCEEHITEAAFLYGLRCKAVRFSELRLFDLLRFDRRLFGHLRGLVVRGDVAWELLNQQLEAEEFPANLLFIAGFLVLASGKPEWYNAYFSIPALQSHTSVIEDAAAWLNRNERQCLLNDADLRKQDIGWRTLLACADASPVLPELLAALPKQSSTMLLRAALRSIGGNRLEQFRHAVSANQDHDDHAVKNDAVCAALKLGDANARRHVWEGEWSQAEPFSELFACAMLHTPKSEQLAALRRLEQEERQREATICVGYAGNADLLPILVKMMQAGNCAPYAGATFRALTGIDISEENAESKPNASRKAEDGQATEDAESSMLNKPDAGKAAAVLDRILDNKENATPLLNGQAVTPAVLAQVLRSGWQFQRTIATLRTMQIGGANWQIRCSEPAHLQRRCLDALDQKAA
jgi:uncharacterized protein (TIGR02270 family)